MADHSCFSCNMQWCFPSAVLQQAVCFVFQQNISQLEIEKKNCQLQTITSVYGSLSDHELIILGNGLIKSKRDREKERDLLVSS